MLAAIVMYLKVKLALKVGGFVLVGGLIGLNKIING